MTARILFIMNHAGAPPGTLLRITREYGARPSVILPLHAMSFEPGLPARLPDDPADFLDDFDGVVILGGAIGVKDAERYPFLDQTRRLIRVFGGNSRPVLGICLGAQLIASAYGAKVYRSPAFEFGFHREDFLPKAHDDSLLRGFTEPLWAMQWHEDSFDLPDGATLLMSGGDVPAQAFRVGGNVYGFQFHFEVDCPILRRWTRMRARELGIDEDKFLAEQEKTWLKHQSRQEKFARIVMTRWLDLNLT